MDHIMIVQVVVVGWGAKHNNKYLTLATLRTPMQPLKKFASTFYEKPLHIDI